MGLWLLLLLSFLLFLRVLLLLDYFLISCRFFLADILSWLGSRFLLWWFILCLRGLYLDRILFLWQLVLWHLLSLGRFILWCWFLLYLLRDCWRSKILLIFSWTLKWLSDYSYKFFHQFLNFCRNNIFISFRGIVISIFFSFFANLTLLDIWYLDLTLDLHLSLGWELSFLYYLHFLCLILTVNILTTL